MTRVPEKITLVNQDDNKSCSMACIAMVTGKPLDLVRGQLLSNCGLTPGMDSMEILKGLSYYQVLGVPVPFTEKLYLGDIYILTVKSKNEGKEFCNAFHHIVGDFRSGEAEIYDPQNGRNEKEYYTEDDYYQIEAIKIIDIHGEK